MAEILKSLPGSGAGMRTEYAVERSFLTLSTEISILSAINLLQKENKFEFSQ
jgi:hypothetical protein